MTQKKANPLKGEVDFDFGGENLIIKFDASAHILLEETYNMPLAKFLTKLENDGRLKDIIFLLGVLLTSGKNQKDDQFLVDNFDHGDIEYYKAKILEVIEKAGNKKKRGNNLPLVQPSQQEQTGIS